MPFVQPKTLMAMSLAAMTAALGGCTTYRPAPKAFNQATIQPYSLDSGDRLRITVFDQATLTNTYTVDQAGYIAFPLIGQVPARGRTLQQLSGQIAQKLQQGYLRDPDVTIDVDRYRSVYIMIDVRNALEARGIIFIASGNQDEGGPGIRLRARTSNDDGIRPENLNAANDD